MTAAQHNHRRCVTGETSSMTQRHQDILARVRDLHRQARRAESLDRQIELDRRAKQLLSEIDKDTPSSTTAQVIEHPGGEARSHAID